MQVAFDASALQVGGADGTSSLLAGGTEGIGPVFFALRRACGLCGEGEIVAFGHVLVLPGEEELSAT